ncbi:CoA-binding protein, partial [Patescibacteria group bacterium]|nr:CoA-binding protein [Patescibacteria group bacterium]
MNQIFNPSSIAVIGASDNHSKTGYTILENIQNSHFKGKIYKINNKGNRFYKSILDIKDDIDMAIIIIPKKEVLEVVKECIQKKISSIVIISGGFRESGDIKSEEEIKKLLKGTKTRIIGPNSCGIFSSHINASFSKNENDKDGNLFLITQSGAILTSLVDFSRSSNLGISKAISLGNKMDISETDIIPNIEPNDFLCFYLESIDNFKEFIKDFGKIENPVFVLSPGKSNKSKLEIKSHTGAIVSDKDILSLGMAKNNIIELSSMEDLFDVSRIFSNLKYKKIKNTKLAIITNAGGMAILATDMMSDNLSFSKFCTSTLNKLNKYFKGRKISNPIDILGDAKSQRYKDISIILDKDIDTDVILTITTPQSSTDVFNIAKVISDFSKNSEKFIISVFTGGYYADKAIEYLTKINIPSYNFPERAIKSLDYLNRFIKNKSRESTYENEDTSLNNKIISIIKNYKDGEILNFKDAVTILKNFDIKFPKFEIVKNIKELEDGIEKIGLIS